MRIRFPFFYAMPSLAYKSLTKVLQISYRSPIDVPFSSMLALIPQSGDFSGAVLGVRSVALLQVPKLHLLEEGEMYAAV